MCKAPSKRNFSTSELETALLTSGMDVIRDFEGRFVKSSQHKYVLKLLQKFEMESWETWHASGIENQHIKEPEKSFRSGTDERIPSKVVVIFFAIYQIEIAFNFPQAAHHMSKPSARQLVAVKRVFRYSTWKGMPDLPIPFRFSKNDLNLWGYGDGVRAISPMSPIWKSDSLTYTNGI